MANNSDESIDKKNCLRTVQLSKIVICLDSGISLTIFLKSRSNVAIIEIYSQSLV